MRKFDLIVEAHKILAILDMFPDTNEPQHLVAWFNQVEKDLAMGAACDLKVKTLTARQNIMNSVYNEYGY